MQRGLLRRTCYNFMKRSASGSPITLTSSMTTTSPQIILDPAEQQLTNLLREAASTSAFSDSQVVVRYAGGWVRDKILRKKSHDIDIAISSISGHQFAVEFAAFLTSQHPDLKTGTITKILANPEKSKHLDTATSRFLNLDLDFVQLRTESYGSADSRTPSVVDVGTLEEDAERRDCTMNALYYNIHTLQVEDPTRHGLDDLANGLLQTPLPPEKTFLDDPLRVLRCIRFASQFDFSIQADTFAGMATKEVREALKCKVVKERVGIEVYKMMKGINPPKAIRALHSQQLYQIVFQDAGPEEEFPWFDFAIVERAINVLSTSLQLRDHLSEYTADGRLWFIVAILPYCRQLRPVPKKKDVEEPLGCVMVRDYLKLTSLLEALVKATFPPREVSVSIDTTPLELGKFVRLLKKDWKLALFVSFVADRAHAVNVDGLVALMDRITECGLDRAWSFTSFIDGKKIKPLLEEHGTHIKVMKELVELVIEYRIEEPDITEEQAMARLREYLKTRPIGPEGW